MGGGHTSGQELIAAGRRPGSLRTQVDGRGDETRGDEGPGEVVVRAVKGAGGLIRTDPGDGVTGEHDGGREGIGAGVDISVVQDR